MAKRISIINFKGGVGKTTLAFHLGTGLVLEDSRVLLVDMDHQSSLSILCLQSDQWRMVVNARRVVDEIFRHMVNPQHPFPGDEIIVEAPMRDRVQDYDKMDIAPASLGLDDIEIDLTGTLHGNPIQSEWNKRTLMCRWIEETGIDDEYDYIIFDCPPATKIVSQNAIAASHGYIIPVVPEAVMERGAPHLRDMMQSGIDAKLKSLAHFGEPRAAYVSDTRLVGLAITRIQTASGGYTIDHRQHLRSLEQYWGNALITPYIEHGTAIPEALSANIPVYNRWKTPNVARRDFDEQFYSLTQEIQARIDAL